MRTAIGWALVVCGFAIAVSVATLLRQRLGAKVLDALAATAGILVAVGGLLVVGDAGLWSWVVAPVVLAAAAVAQRRALFAPGGPFRT